MDYYKTLLQNDGLNIHMVGEDKGYLTNRISGDVYEINSTTKRILELCDGTKNIKEIVETILEIDEDNCITEDDVLSVLSFFNDEAICEIG